MSTRQVCGLIRLGESSYRYTSRRNDEPLRQRLKEAAREKRRWGYRRLQIVLQQSGLVRKVLGQVSHKRGKQSGKNGTKSPRTPSEF